MFLKSKPETYNINFKVKIQLYSKTQTIYLILNLNSKP